MESFGIIKKKKNDINGTTPEEIKVAAAGHKLTTLELITAR